MEILNMQVHKYIPDRLFGFAINEKGQQVFFHLGAFRPGAAMADTKRCSDCPPGGCIWSTTPAPPILGERIKVQVDTIEPDEQGKAPRARVVTRLDPPIALEGKVDMFSPHNGFGFIVGEDGQSYHLHASEVMDGKVPLPAQSVRFYAGTRQGRGRACHVRIC